MSGRLNLALLDVHLDQEQRLADVSFEVYSKKKEAREQHAVLSVRVPFMANKPHLSEIQREAGRALLCELDQLREQVGPVTNPADLP